MKFDNHEELSKYIFEQYLTFGKYSTHDKAMYDAFELGVETMADFKKAARLLSEAMDNPHPHLDAGDYAFVGRCAQTRAIEAFLMSLDNDEYEAWCTEIEAIVGEGEGKETLCLELTEV